ncbi:UNVERIFIED_CONTAM: hypothetical protein PYX00_010991 [Menopon gallinae]|uniref:Phosphotyrosine protein phosphatase I domain-containing protein n=1 Tax=Menopon gallinae TaxID=328185 RepID=A0AAW2H778_9NEOP
MFVCAGNICRSPLAHAMFDAEVCRRGLSEYFKSESSGTNGFHVGDLPDERTRKNARSHGLELNHISRRFLPQDLEEWDLLLVMDNSNYQNVVRHARSSQQKNKVFLYREWDLEDKGSEVPDPYLGGEEGFEEVYQIVKRTTQCLLDDLQERVIKS